MAEHNLRGADGETTAACHCPIGRDHTVAELEATLGPAQAAEHSGGTKMLRGAEDKMLRGSGGAC